jgi:predicted RNA-binding Zn-ribbon protein involved in translation (DUF1610 family)
MTDCLVCGNEIIGRNKGAKYCKDYCRNRAARLKKKGKTYTYKRICVFCGTEFTASTNHVQYCPECVKHQVYNNNKKARDYAKKIGVNYARWYRNRYNW